MSDIHIYTFSGNNSGFSPDGRVWSLDSEIFGSSRIRVCLKQFLQNLTNRFRIRLLQWALSFSLYSIAITRSPFHGPMSKFGSCVFLGHVFGFRKDFYILLACSVFVRGSLDLWQTVIWRQQQGSSQVVTTELTHIQIATKLP